MAEKVTPIRKPVDMYQVRITTWPHRPNTFSWQLLQWEEDAEGGTLVRRGQSIEVPVEMIKKFLAGLDP